MYFTWFSYQVILIIFTFQAFLWRVSAMFASFRSRTAEAPAMPGKAGAHCKHSFSRHDYESSNRRNNKEINFLPPAWKAWKINVHRACNKAVLLSILFSIGMFLYIVFWIYFDSYSRFWTQTHALMLLGCWPTESSSIVVMRMSMMWNYQWKRCVGPSSPYC